MESIDSIISYGSLAIIILLLVISLKQSREAAQTKQQIMNLADEKKAISSTLTTLSELCHSSFERFDKRLFEQNDKQADKLHGLTQSLNDQFHQLKSELANAQAEHRNRFEQRQTESLKLTQDTHTKANLALQQQTQQALQQHSQLLGEQFDKLTDVTQQQLKDISQQVEKRLSDGFEKTTATFTDVIKRLALIDQAQQKITELSSNVVSLQSVLTDKRSRGAFGEVQLAGLIRNSIPEQHVSFQHTLSNGKRVDCLLFLPQPTGNIAIDAKFPLESYQLLMQPGLSAIDSKQLEQQFKQDIKKHINDIASKYIIPNETSDGAMLFIPAEAIFAEIHSNYPDLIELAQKQRVWLVSPTTLMAILTTARAVLKDEATRKQVHIIQEHLGVLAKDFGRFQTRMDNLSRHFSQVQTDVEQAHTSARKITSRFQKIEKVEVDALDQPIAEQLEAEI